VFTEAASESALTAGPDTVVVLVVDMAYLPSVSDWRADRDRDVRLAPDGCEQWQVMLQACRMAAVPQMGITTHPGRAVARLS
jgi:hypothetical protein